jgi:hypothetical protein
LAPISADAEAKPPKSLTGNEHLRTI